MIVGALLQLLTSLLNALYNALPTWSIQFGGPPAGSGGGFDNGWLMSCFGYLAYWDRLLPIHEAFFPIMYASFSITTAIYAVSLVKGIVNLVRGSGI